MHERFVYLHFKRLCSAGFALFKACCELSAPAAGGAASAAIGSYLARAGFGIHTLHRICQNSIYLIHKRVHALLCHREQRHILVRHDRVVCGAHFVVKLRGLPLSNATF